MANPVVNDFLNESLTRFPNADQAAITQPLMALGEMLDMSSPKKPKPAPVLAIATGAAGEYLRLAHVEDSTWAWKGNKVDKLHLSMVDLIDKYEDVLWAADALPISQIKFSSDRWLLVQKKDVDYNPPASI